MDKYRGLLSAVSRQYHIHKGQQETENHWKIRLIYSICGLMAYASLWDHEREPISIVHLKTRIRSMLANYQSMYPELLGELSALGDFQDEIANQFLYTGVVYHCSRRVVLSMKREELFSDILFQRGIALDHISCVSGIGLYSKQDGGRDPDRIKAMFGLAQEKLQTLWHTTLGAASWKSTPSFEYGVEYLRLKPPFSHGYWVNTPDTTGTVSILRTGMKDSQLYYLYRYRGTSLEVSPVPQWQAASEHCKTLVCACLSAHGTLPPIEYTQDGALVHIHMNDLLPPRELAFLKLYSWPEMCSSSLSNFNRTLSTEVFTAIQNVLSHEGYEWKGESI